MKNYIVRIYRCEENKPNHFVGLVEQVGSRQKQAFSTYDELWSILKPEKTLPQKKQPIGGSPT